MNILFYIPFEGNEKINRLVSEVSLLARINIFQSIKDFSRRLCRPLHSHSVAVLIVDSKKQFLNIISIRSLLLEIPVILILPTREESTTAMGYTLVPRFLTYADGNLDEVVAVLGKMAEKYNKKKDARREEPYMKVNGIWGDRENG